MHSCKKIKQLRATLVLASSAADNNHQFYQLLLRLLVVIDLSIALLLLQRIMMLIGNGVKHPASEPHRAAWSLLLLYFGFIPTCDFLQRLVWGLKPELKA